MAVFQFFHNGKVLTYIDINSATCREEEKQLREQGFTDVGDIIQAENAKVAIKKFRDTEYDDLKEYAAISVLCCLANTL
ncbi:hypothetical protein C942_02868 [Photobacterium marinum]|uniref:Uncharacterized protein n=1 Tax=Photobacterium marinum TaxID=1056511 RepID=L8J6B1_9GAMM|nr:MULTISPECIES: hypothetical protein [Photobacterium]ELR64286.1 hypothetical protein C942_02868 [Photobacterium marinum]